MGLFDSPFDRTRQFLEQKRREGVLREFGPRAAAPWPEGSVLILEEGTALELGNPAVGSLSYLVWREAAVEGADRVLLVGPDLPEIRGKSAPLAQVVMVTGEFPEAYECYQDLRDSIFEVRLEGMMTRVLPSRQTLWVRLDQKAREGLSLVQVGAAIIGSIRELDFARSVEVLFVTSGREDLAQLEGPAEEAGRITGAMMKMSEEMNFECDSCEYWDVCETVAELKKLRSRREEAGP